jgi:transcriptional regulator with XRE-family HTH domain
MNSCEAFGPNLRRLRLQRNVSLESIAQATNVPVPLWEAFEENDLNGWPSGVLARAFVSEYARLIGEDPDERVNEFCRLFPLGDRRRGRVMAEVADFLGQPLVWTEDPPPGEERRAPLQRAQQQQIASQRQELATTLIDLATVTVVSTAAAFARRIPYPTALLVVGSLYYLGSAVTDTSLGTAVIRAYRLHRETRSMPAVSPLQRPRHANKRPSVS